MFNQRRVGRDVRALLAVAIGGLLAIPSAAISQEVVSLSGAEGSTARELLADILRDNDYEVLSRDTVLPDSFHAQGDIVIWSADVRLEGTVDGRVAVVDGVLFVRPGATIRGPIAVVGGEFYPSGIADIPAATILPVDVDTETALRGDTLFVILHPPPAKSPFSLSGFSGLSIPTYDRVDGATIRVGVEADWPAGVPRFELSTWADYHSARGDLDGGAAAEFRATNDYWLVAQASASTQNNEEWNKGDLANSLAALFFRSDARDYYHSDALSLSFIRRLDDPLIQGEYFIGPRITFLYSDDSSLDNRAPWSVFSHDEPWRNNPPIADGTIGSVTLGADLGWIGMGASFEGDVAVEWAPGGVSDFEFSQLTADGVWTMAALWGHSISVHGRAMSTLFGAAAPPQRWSSLGGSGTLSTFEFDDFRGDHLAFVESVYSAPLAWAKLPLVGVPTLQFRHAVGMAWTGSDAPPWEQNLGIRLKVLLVHATLYIDPGSDEFEPKISFGTSF
ncbi:MAG TPA: polymer-forming cytoskeletal protein [Longimicrobiaceae bacterium]|nr:polymer-forming cytoskeletal protein [Longimicrobiaceae bacterium]